MNFEILNVPQLLGCTLETFFAFKKKNFFYMRSWTTSDSCSNLQILKMLINLRFYDCTEHSTKQYYINFDCIGNLV